MTATPEKRRSTRRARIDKHQAAQAIYIDFESIPGEEPTILGFAWNGIWTAAILDRELADAANWKVPGGNAVALTPNEALTVVRSIAMWKNRKVCAWSEHELRTIQRIYAKQPNTRKWWEENLINVRRQAVSFVRQHELPVTPIVNRKTGRESIGHQAVIMEALGIDVPAAYGRGVAADGIKALRNFRAEHGSLDAVDDETKQKWMAMLLHNRYDCFGMAAIMCPVTKGLGRVLYPWIWEMDPHKDTHIPSRFLRSSHGADRRTQNGERNA